MDIFIHRATARYIGLYLGSTINLQAKLAKYATTRLLAYIVGGNHSHTATCLCHSPNDSTRMVDRYCCKDGSSCAMISTEIPLIYHPMSQAR